MNSSINIPIISASDFPKYSKKEESLIIFGGTFDPVHEGHLNDILTLCSLARTVIIAPTAQNPWKRESATPLIKRLTMLKLALEDQQILFSNEINSFGLILLNDPYIYSADLALSIIKTRNTINNEKYFWAIGDDLKEQAPGWKNWNDIAIPFVSLPLINGLSSTSVREGTQFPLPSIEKFIKDNNLYQ